MNLLSKNEFVLLLAKRNINANKKTTAVIMITLSLIFAMFIMMLGIKGIYKTIFTKESQNMYPNIDIVISYDEYSPARFINKRALTEDYEDIEYALAFFNLQVVSMQNEDLLYANMFSSLAHEFEIFMDIDVNITSSQTIITKSYAEKFDLDIGEKVIFYILGVEYEYTIIDIVDDKGAFSGDSFFVEKSALLKKIYNLDYLDNFGNKIFIKATNIENTYGLLIENSSYQNYSIRLVVDEERIEGLINEYISIIALAGIIVLVSLVIVLDSLFLIVLRDIYQEIGVFETLGDNKKSGYKVCYYQWSLYVLISFIIGLILSHIVVNIGANIYGIKEFILVNPIIVLISLLIIVLMIFIKNTFLIKKHYQKKTVEKIRDKRYVLAKFNYILLLVSFIIFLVTIIFKPFSLRVDALIIVLNSFYISLNLLIIILKVFSIILSKRKSSFALFNTKHMINNKNIHQALSVIFIALIVVTVMLTVRFFISDQIEEVRRDNKFDIVLTNIYDYDDNLINEISAYDVSDVNPILIYENALVDINTDTRFLIKMIVSINDTDFNKYYGYEIDVEEIYLNHDLPYILLPKSYEIVYNLSPGDTIKMDLAPELRDFSFVVGGFINTDFDQFAYTNLVEKLEEYSLKYNAIMINSDNSEVTISALIEDYGSQMYYLIDGQAELEKQLDRASSVLELFTVITIFIVLSFMFVVFNNTLLKFYSLKNDYSKIKVLGISDRQNRVNLLFEFLILCTVLVLVGIIEVLILSKYLRYTLLFFDYYKELSANVFVTVISYLLIFISLLISYVYYYIKIKNLSLSEEIRIA